VTVRPTGGDAYADGTGAFKPAERRIERGSELRGRRTVEVDACVVGSGAGGAVAAMELAEAGLRVALLEEGEWWDTGDLTARPREMTAALYRDAGQMATVGRPPILLPVGRGVGGTTLVNAGTCFRTPEPVLEKWDREHGLSQLHAGELDPYFRRVERILHVAQVPAAIAGRNAAVVRRGAEALGWSGDFLYRNARGCVGSGVCTFGCPTGAKQHVGITYVPRAWAAGATSWTGARVTRLLMDGSRRRVTGVEAETAGGGTLRVLATHTVLACGALHTPLLLRRHGLGTASGQLGRNLSIHPATGVRALFDEVIEMWHGVPQSYFIDEFAHEGLMFEGAAGPPDYLAAASPASGAELAASMQQARHLSQFGVMVSDTSRGTVRELLGRPLVRYDLNARDTAAFRRGIELLTELYWAAGAREVIVPVAGVGTLRDGDSSPLQRARWSPGALKLMAFHPLGTARAGADPGRSVVDADLRVHGVDGLLVADGSVVPSSLGVNPQQTILARATRMARRLTGTPAPVDEPEPDHIARPRTALAETGGARA
jgi:choline dehydrogenase-like flavoprotein